MSEKKIKELLEKLDIMYIKLENGKVEIAEEITVAKLIETIKATKKLDI